MDAIKLKTHVGEDGILKLEVPVDIVNRDVEVTLTFDTLAQVKKTDANGWPIGYFDLTYGSLADHPIERGDQGQAEIREPLK